MSAQNTFMTAIRVMHEYLPADLKELEIAIVGRALSEPKNRRIPDRGDMDWRGDPLLVGRSPAMQDIHRVLARLMQTDHGGDHRRERHRQVNWSRARCTTTANAAPPLLRHQHGGDPARPDRVRSSSGYEKGVFTGAACASGRFLSRRSRYAAAFDLFGRQALLGHGEEVAHEIADVLGALAQGAAGSAPR